MLRDIVPRSRDHSTILWCEKVGAVFGRMVEVG